MNPHLIFVVETNMNRVHTDQINVIYTILDKRLSSK